MARKPAKRAKRAAAAAEPAENGASAVDKIAGLLALIATKETAALKLDAIGFSGREIAALLDVNENFTRVARFRTGKKR
ncbi:FixJ family two-component response regulator [Bradyrhizobium sp. AZCC 1693]